VYGGSKQIKAREALMVRPSGEHIIDLIAADQVRFPGIGKTYARRLYGDLGERLRQLLNEKDDFSLADTMRRLGIPNADDAAQRMVEGGRILALQRLSPGSTACH